MPFMQSEKHQKEFLKTVLKALAILSVSSHFPASISDICPFDPIIGSKSFGFRPFS